MLKKTVVLGSVITGICAVPTHAHGSFFKSGFLAGGHVGASFGTGSHNSTFDTAAAPGSASASGKAKKTSALFGILAGYRHIFNEGFTLGFDVSGNVYTNNDLKKTLNHVFAGVNVPFVNKVSRRYSVIPSINFGKVFCGRWHVALGLGLGISGFKHQVNAPFPTAVNPLNNASSSRTRLGFVPSVGAEYAVNQNVSVVGNVSYEMYQKVSKTYGNELTTPAFLGSSYKTSVNPKYLTLKVGAVYRF